MQNTWNTIQKNTFVDKVRQQKSSLMLMIGAIESFLQNIVNIKKNTYIVKLIRSELRSESKKKKLLFLSRVL